MVLASSEPFIEPTPNSKVNEAPILPSPDDVTFGETFVRLEKFRALPLYIGFGTWKNSEISSSI